MFVATLLFENGSLDVFSSPENYSAIGLWGGMFGYSIQLYCDFSGYTDLARGSALLLGFDIPENFRQPYSASNLGDFWQRWHITFSQWLRDYIYIPIGWFEMLSKPHFNQPIHYVFDLRTVAWC